MTNSSIINTKKDFIPNERQQECIDNITGSYMVLAGPGTGKTFTLTRRIKAMIEKHGVNPEEILCLTYSETAANEMKTKLIGLLGNIAVNLHISTYHSFCNEIIQTYPEKFNLQENVKLIDAISKELLAKKCLDDAYETGIDLSIITDKKTGSYYGCQNDLLKVVSDMKKYRISKEQIFKNIEINEEWQPKLNNCLILKEEKLQAAEKSGKPAKIKTLLTDIENLEKKISKAKLLTELAEKYQLLMNKQNYIDFDDMVIMVIDAAEEDAELGREALGKYKYILVDEYQDTNTVQNILIDRVIQYAESGNIFVVGDDDQIIYGFQGASLNNCENFLRKYPQTKVICLVENNRSTQAILDFGNQVITQDLNRLENNIEFKKYNISKKLTAKNKDVTALDSKIKYTIYNEKIEENNNIVEQIKEIISNLAENEQLSSIAILAKKNNQIDEIAALLENANIPYQRKAGKSIFDIPSSLLLYSYLKILNNPKTSVDKQYSILMQEPFKIDEDDYEYILSQNRPLKRDFISIMEENKDYKWKNPEKINNFMTTYKKLNDLKFKKSLRTFVLHVANEAGILSYYANSKIDVEENILAIKRLIVEAATYKDIYLNSFLTDEVTPGPYLSNFLAYLDKCYKSGAAPELEKTQDVLNAVQIMTYHGSKGREFNHVFMPWLSNRYFEKARAPYDFSVPHSEKAPTKEEKEEKKISELLKLLFVGITRAKYDLRLSFSLYEDDNPRELSDLMKNALTDNPLVDMQLAEHKNIIEESIKTITAPLKNNYAKDLEERINNLQLSAHSFNLYRKCPRAYLYSEVYKIPTEIESSNALDFGNAIHKAFQKLVQNAKITGKYLSKDEVLNVFYDFLSTCEFEDEKTYEAYKNRGKETIESYYHHITDIPVKQLFATEYRFDNVSIAEIPLKGFIDLIIKNNDGTYSLYDYKTGKAKSQSSIAPEKAYEHYWNQLVFYQLAFESLGENKVSETGLKFVEEAGKDVNFHFVEQELNDVKFKIQETAKNIKQFKFNPIDSKTNSKICSDCEYCLICRINK